MKKIKILFAVFVLLINSDFSYALNPSYTKEQFLAQGNTVLIGRVIDVIEIATEIKYKNAVWHTNQVYIEYKEKGIVVFEIEKNETNDIDLHVVRIPYNRSYGTIDGFPFGFKHGYFGEFDGIPHRPYPGERYEVIGKFENNLFITATGNSVKPQKSVKPSFKYD